jgi:predicted lipid-binding transport protein (Tim44 family)
MVDELIRRRKMLVDSVSQNGYNPLKVDPSKITEIKQNFQADVPSTQFGQPMSEMNKAAGTKKAYRSLISGIEEAVPGTKKLGREESALIKLKEIADNQVARQSAKQNINFSRLGGAGLGGLIGGVPGAIQGYVLEQIANSPQFLQLMTKGSRAASKVKLPKTNVFSKLVKGAQINRMVNPK